MIRTIWLGFTFLIVLAAAGSFKFAFGNFGAANASSIGRAKVGRVVIARAVQPTITNTEHLLGAHVSPAPAVAELAPVVAELARFDPISVEPAPRTSPVPLLKGAAKSQRRERATGQTQDRKSNRKIAKSEVVANKYQQTVEPKSCQLEEFDVLRWAFNLPTGCHT